VLLRQLNAVIEGRLEDCAEPDSPQLSDALAEAVAACTSGLPPRASGGFPMPAGLDEAVPPLPVSFDVTSYVPAELRPPWPLELLVRPSRQHQTSQFDVGMVLWPAALVLARWLCRNAALLRGKSVLELGAGMGLAGLAAAHLARRVCLTDFNPLVLENLRANVELNLREAAPTAEGE
jgi:hypothetical protein